MGKLAHKDKQKNQLLFKVRLKKDGFSLISGPKLSLFNESCLFNDTLLPLSFFCGDGGLIGFEFIHPFKRKTAV